MIKNNHEYKYQLFVEMWEDDYTVAEIAKRLRLREFAVAGKNFKGRYYREHPHVKPGRINVDRMMALVHELENRKQNYGDMDVFDITGRPFTYTVMIYEDNEITLQIRS